ncbi:splicing regulator SDE2 [Skeletonema marinoi]|uniref:Splicing regulator SDE2 n=1 Tax=Skeletonema marinoi TaxID=267567 RepID=A0AAD8Y382_9STRA|nr:splicing regulator SDE2 [Skeletonema marinoi]
MAASCTTEPCCGLPHSEYHELLVTYEGPLHPASKHSRNKTLCIRLPHSGVDETSTPYVSEQHVLASLSERLGWPASMLCIDGSSSGSSSILFPTQSFLLSGEEENNVASTTLMHQHHPLTAKIHPRHTLIRGGKGGFGTLLKGQSKQAGAKTTLDFGACRDLSGRRLRHVNDEVKLRKWRELQQKREKGEEVDELAALKTESGIRNWHLMVPSWSDGAAFTNKGKRKHERQLEREVRSWQSKEERANRQKEEKKMEQEWAVMEYVRRGEVESARVSADNMKEGILAHLKKRKLEKQEISQPITAAGLVSTDANNSEIEQDLIMDKDGNSSASSLITLSGEMSVVDVPHSEQTTKLQGRNDVKQIRIQSESDFATVGVLLDAAKLKETPNQGIHIEYTIQTAGLAQIGWIRVPTTSKDDVEIFLPNSDTGDGVGDDNVSFGYDGSRKLKFNGGTDTAYGSVQGSKEKELVEWNAGDILASWCRRSTDGNTIEIGYLLNGNDLGVAFSIAAGSNDFGYYPALSLNLGEVVDINLGPEFSHDVKEGCVGVSHLSKTSSDESHEEGVSSKPEAKSYDDAPPQKRPRDEDSMTMSRPASANATAAIDTFDLNNCSSVQELLKLGSDRLKSILLSMGIKCGGTPEQRADRLFSLKGLRREDYPQKVRGKNFIL